MDTKPTTTGARMRASQYNNVEADLRRRQLIGAVAGGTAGGVDSFGPGQLFHTPFQGSYAPGENTLTIGRDRAYTGASAEPYKYPWLKDLIEWTEPTGVISRLSVTAADTIVITADNIYAYYEITNTTGTIAKTLKQSTVWPPSPDPSDTYTRIVLLGIVRFDSGASAITNWSQIQQGHIAIAATRDNQSDFRGISNDSDNVVVSAGHVMIGTGTSLFGVAAKTYALDTATFVYVEMIRTSGTWAVTSTLQDNATEPDPREESSGDITRNLVIGEVTSGGEWEQWHLGTIHFGDEQAAAVNTDELVASKSGATANYLDVVITDGDTNTYGATNSLQVKGDNTAANELQLYIKNYDNLTEITSVSSTDWVLVMDHATKTQWKTQLSDIRDAMISGTNGVDVTAGVASLDINSLTTEVTDVALGDQIAIADASAAGATKWISPLNLLKGLMALASDYDVAKNQLLGHETGNPTMLDLIVQTEAMKEITGHGNSKTMKTTGAGEPNWETV